MSSEHATSKTDRTSRITLDFFEISEMSSVIITAAGMATSAASVWERMIAVRPRMIVTIEIDRKMMDSCFRRNDKIRFNDTIGARNRPSALG